jgi:hypothetical protein
MLLGIKSASREERERENLGIYLQMAIHIFIRGGSQAVL